MHPSQETDRKILSSWKDIAAYMGRGVRTVQRYEHLGLPVIRLNGHFQSSVMAFTNEIDAWIRETAMRSFVPIMPIGPAEWLANQGKSGRANRGQPDPPYFFFRVSPPKGTEVTPKNLCRY